MQIFEYSFTLFKLSGDLVIAATASGFPVTPASSTFDCLVLEKSKQYRT